MRSIYLTSDQHWNHANILNFTDSNTGKRIRPEFDTLEQMNESMIESWNSVVKPEDHVCHLGDICMSDYQGFEQNILSKLHGKITLIVGNHDDIRKLSVMRRFRKIAMIRRFDDMGIVCSHIPLHKESCWNYRKGFYLRNVHGHIHQNDPATDHDYVNVCVERTNYMPVNIEELRII